MVRSSFLATAIAAALSMNLHLGLVMGLFSVHDDILAFPQVCREGNMGSGRLGLE